MNADDGVTDGPSFTEPVEVEVDRRLWNLEVRVETMDAAAAAWRDCALQAAVDADDIPNAPQLALGDDVLPRLRRMANLASQVAKELELAATQLRQRQEWLDEMLTDLMASIPAGDRRVGAAHPGPMVLSRSTSGFDSPSHVVFRAHSFQDLRLIEEAKANAKRVRQRAGETLDGMRASLETVTRQFQQLGGGHHGAVITRRAT